MTIAQANAELVDNLSTYFARRNEPNVAWGNVGVFMQLPGLRGYWPMSSVDENGAVYDLSGQGRTLTNNSSAQFGVYNGLAPYVIGDGTADYLSRADEAGLDITGALTAYAWVWSGVGSGTRAVMGKYLGAGNQRSWLIHTESLSTVWVTSITPDGTAAAIVSSFSTVPVVQAAWTLVVLVYVPSTSLTLYVSDGGRMVATTNVTSIPASLFNSTAAFTIAAQDGPGTWWPGRVAQSALCAVAHDNLTVQTLFHQTRALFGR